MSVQLEAPCQPAAAPRPPASIAPPPASPGSADSLDDAPDPDRGLGLLLSFTGAASVMVGDVVLIGAVDRSWVLIPGYVVLLLTTAVVFRGIMRLLADGGEATPAMPAELRRRTTTDRGAR